MTSLSTSNHSGSESISSPSMSKRMAWSALRPERADALTDMGKDPTGRVPRDQVLKYLASGWADEASVDARRCWNDCAADGMMGPILGAAAGPATTAPDAGP